MHLYFLRHGPAGDPETWQGNDDDRPLTPDGRELMASVAEGLHALELGVDALISSPLRRANETATIVAAALHLTPMQASELAKGCMLRQLADVLSRLPDKQTESVIVTGHEPDLSRMVARCIGEGEANIHLKKGGCCRVDIPGPVSSAHDLDGKGRLEWLMTPALLTAIGGKPKNK
jgi:phosphohistidine phosphatase